MWKSNNPGIPNFANHLLENKNTVRNIENNIKILKFAIKKKNMTTWENFLFSKENAAKIRNYI